MPLNRTERNNLITTAAELDFCVRFLKKKNIQTKHVCRILDVSEVTLWNWRHEIHPFPAWAAQLIWFNFQLGKREVAALRQKAATELAAKPAQAA